MTVQPIGYDRTREIERAQLTRSTQAVPGTDEVDTEFDEAVAREVRDLADPTVAALNGNLTQTQLVNEQLTNQLLAEQDQAALELVGDISAQQQTSFAQALQADRNVDTSQQMLASQALRSPSGMDLLAGAPPQPSAQDEIGGVDGLAAGQATGATEAGDDEYASPDFATGSFSSTGSDFAAAAGEFGQSAGDSPQRGQDRR